jgi:hypothetical protein
MEDEYIIEDDGYRFTFKKNGLIHREVGPAFFWHHNKNKYFNLEDIELYKKINIEPSDDEKDLLSIANLMYDISEIKYYLNGIHYSEQLFHTMKEKMHLEKELSETLLDTKIKIKKVKI